MVVCGSCGRPGTNDNLLRPSEATGNLLHADCEARELAKFKGWVEGNIAKEQAKNDKQERESLAEGIMRAAESMDADGLKNHARTFFRKYDRSRAQFLAALWLLKTHNVMVEERTNILRTYDVERGFYTATGEEVLTAAVVREFGRYLARGTTGEVLHFVRAKAHVRDREITETTPPNLLCLQNGVLDINTLTLHPHTPARYFLTGLPVNWNPEAKCPAIERYLSEVVTPTDRERLLDFFGLALYRRHFLEKFWILVGEGNNGKSRVPVLASALVGSESMSSVTLAQLSDNGTVSAAQLYGKLVNVAGDISSGVIRDAAWLKRLTGGEPITAAGKYQRHFQFTNYATMLFSSNDPPRFVEDTGGLWRRPVLIKFSARFGSENDVAENPGWKLADPHIDKKLTTPEELEGLLVLAVEALRGILERKSLRHQASTATTRSEYRRISDPAGAFLEECCEPADYLEGEQGTDVEGAIPSDELYQSFKRFCQEHGIKLQNRDWFVRNLKKVPGWDLETGRDRFGGIQHRTVRGVALRHQDTKTPFPIVHPISPKRSCDRNKEEMVSQETIFTYKEIDDKTPFFDGVSNGASKGVLPEIVIPPYPAVAWLRARLGSLATPAEIASGAGLSLDAVMDELCDAAARGEVYEPRDGFWGAL